MKGKCGDTPMQEFVTFEEKNVCLLSQGKRGVKKNIVKRGIKFDN